ncbi:MAG: DUF932 domain-containing protein [Planctomycetaceae bacterium]|nr:DUF932 domain-containing protein [Planctomycetaceae bacterium]
MTTLTAAHQELFHRTPDECFDSFETLYDYCRRQRAQSHDLWEPPERVLLTHDMTLCVNEDGTELRLNDWSFSQLCRMAGVSKETINRLSAKTASKALEETLPRSGKPLQLLQTGDAVRSVHGVAYTRLWNDELLDVVQEFASDFSPPQKAYDDVHTGLYCGEQDLFAFLIDPGGWTEINGEAFAPGFFVWNSEVGRRSLGIQTFWFQRVCANHIVWDATEVTEFSRKHTAGVREGLDEIRRMIETLVKYRDDRRDGFARIMQIAMKESLGHDAEEVTKKLSAEKIPRQLIKEALEIARRKGGYTIFALVDALTHLSQDVRYAGDRVELDARIGKLMALAMAA